MRVTKINEPSLNKKWRDPAASHWPTDTRMPYWGFKYPYHSKRTSDIDCKHLTSHWTTKVKPMNFSIRCQIFPKQNTINFSHSSKIQCKEAVMLKQIHRSKEDLWWTESCLRLRDFTCTYHGDYEEWRMHDLDRGHVNAEQKFHFENKALWLCARCEDVGQRNGRRLAHMTSLSFERK